MKHCLTRAEVGAILRGYKRNSKTTYKSIAQYAGMSPSTVSRISRDIRHVDKKYVKRLYHYLMSTELELINDDDVHELIKKNLPTQDESAILMEGYKATRFTPTQIVFVSIAVFAIVVFVSLLV